MCVCVSTCTGCHGVARGSCIVSSLLQFVLGVDCLLILHLNILYELACMVHLYGTPVWYTCMVHLYGTPVWYTCMVYLYGTPVWYR